MVLVTSSSCGCTQVENTNQVITVVLSAYYKWVYWPLLCFVNTRLLFWWVRAFIQPRTICFTTWTKFRYVWGFPTLRNPLNQYPSGRLQRSSTSVYCKACHCDGTKPIETLICSRVDRHAFLVKWAERIECYRIKAGTYYTYLFERMIPLAALWVIAFPFSDLPH